MNRTVARISFLLCACLIGGRSFAEGSYKLSMSGSGQASHAGLCLEEHEDSRQGVWFTGSVESLQIRLYRVTNIPFRARLFESRWPKNLKITVRERMDSGDLREMSPDEVQRLTITPMINRDPKAVAADSAFLGAVIAPLRFWLHVPQNFAGKYMVFAASFQADTIGELTSQPFGVFIKKPCNREAEDCVQASYVDVAMERGDYQAVLSLADSLVKTGWKSLRGYYDAKGAAKMLGRHDDVTRYRDLMMKEYGPNLDGDFYSE
jgi:hypothetical protein